MPNNQQFKKGHTVSIEIRNKISLANKGNIPWNKGIKCKPNPKSKEWREKMSKSMIGNTNGKGNKGRIFSDETRNKMSISQTGKTLSETTRMKMSDYHAGKIPNNINCEGKFMNVKRGWYDINGKKMFFRSKWEVNYALYLDWLKSINQIKDWKYESRVFMFDNIKLGTRSYRPDFEITNNDGSIHFDEIKGYMDPKSATKLKRMRIYYPEIKMNLIDGKAYNDIKKKVGRMLNFY